MSEQIPEGDARRNDVAMWLVRHDPDPCDPVEYDAAAYYRAFAEALIASGWRIIPPATPGEPS